VPDTTANTERECWIANPIGVFRTRRGLVQLINSGLSDDEYRAQGWHEIEDPLVDGHGEGAVRCARAANVFDNQGAAIERHYTLAANYAAGLGTVPLTERIGGQDSHA